jgi:hypothetical protein
MLTRTLILALTLVSAVRAFAAAPVPVLHFYDETKFRHLALTQADFGKIKVEIRSVAGPGDCSKWVGDGQKREKEFVFSRVVGEEENRGTVYIGTGGESRFAVKLKPKQEKAMMDEGVVGDYHHITEERRFQLAKKELENADKRLAELLKTQAKMLKGEDRAVAAEIKQRWPALRSRIMNITYKAPAPVAPAVKPPLGTAPRTDDASGADKNADRLWALVEADASEIGFVGGVLDPKVKEGVDGDYNDGHGGTITVYLNAKSGELRFTLNCSRGGDTQTGMLGGTIAPKPMKKDATGDAWLDYVHNDPAETDASKQARVRLKRVGHYFIVETEHAERYTGLAWFDGIYRKQPPAIE